MQQAREKAGRGGSAHWRRRRRRRRRCRRQQPAAFRLQLDALSSPPRSYEAYLHSFVTDADRKYLQSEEMALRIVELG